jgi:hypothetical protein
LVVAQDDAEFGVGVVGLVVAVLRVELLAEECVALLRAPARGAKPSTRVLA